MLLNVTLLLVIRRLTFKRTIYLFVTYTYNLSLLRFGMWKPYEGTLVEFIGDLYGNPARRKFMAVLLIQLYHTYGLSIFTGRNEVGPR